MHCISCDFFTIKATLYFPLIINPLVGQVQGPVDLQLGFNHLGRYISCKHIKFSQVNAFPWNDIFPPNEKAHW